MRCVSPLRIAALLVLAVAPAARAELPPLSPDELQADASHIVAGVVTHVFTEQVRKDADRIDDLYCVEIRVVDVEKGDGIDPARALHVRTWKAVRRPEGWAGPGGQYEIPAAGALVRVHLRLAEGVFEVLLPNGFQAAETVTGTLRHKPWTKSAESWEAGGSDYFVLEDERGTRLHFVRATAAVGEDDLKALRDRRVEIRGAIVPGRRIPLDPSAPRPVDPASPEDVGSRRVEHGFRVYEAKAAG